jgi:protein-disulfide isomerase
MAFLGEESQWAAEASECAADQDSFWAYHDKLFSSQNGENQGAFNKDKLKGFAAELKLDSKAFDACLDSGKYTQLVQSDTAAAQSLGAQSTPSFFVNDWLVLGALPIEEFDNYIAKAKQGLHPAPTPTPLPQGIDFFEADPSRAGLTYDGSPTQGKADAGLVLLSFEDYKNADAAKHATAIEPALKTKYVDSGQMRLVVKPLADTAPRAAVAAVCAGRQGKFWEFRSLLYQKQAEWQEGDDAAMSGYAKSLGLDQAAFDACLKDEKAQNEVDYATKFGQEIGVPVVPSFLVLKIGANGKAENSKGLPGAQTLEQIEQAIKDLQAPPTPTPVAIAPEKLASLQVGVDSDGNFYRGDPNAPIKLVDFSDFQ